LPNKKANTPAEHLATAPGSVESTLPPGSDAEYARAVEGMGKIVDQIKDIRASMAADQAAIDYLRAETETRLARLSRLLDARAEVI
jgi:hypothetical protein